MNNHYNERNELAKALVDDKAAIIKFFVVSDPENDEEECEDIAFCYIDMKEILNSKENFIGRQLKLIDAKTENIIVGYMTVTVEILDVLLAIQSQIDTTD